MGLQPPSLLALPVELLYVILVLAGNPSFPIASKHLYLTFKDAPQGIKAHYLLNALNLISSTHLPSGLTTILNYPICTPIIVERFLSLRAQAEPTDRYLIPMRTYLPIDPKRKFTSVPTFYLPRRLFRNLDKPEVQESTIAFVEYLATISIPSTESTTLRANPNIGNGYPLLKAVEARCMPLIRLLLSMGAQAGRRGALAVLMAIRQGDLRLVRLLVDGVDREDIDGKRGVVCFGISVEPAMLREAVKAKATDIVEWLMFEKRVVPDMDTLRALG